MSYCMITYLQLLLKQCYYRNYMAVQMNKSCNHTSKPVKINIIILLWFWQCVLKRQRNNISSKYQRSTIISATKRRHMWSLIKCTKKDLKEILLSCSSVTKVQMLEKEMNFKTSVEGPMWWNHKQRSLISVTLLFFKKVWQHRVCFPCSHGVRPEGQHQFNLCAQFSNRLETWSV